MTQLTINIPDKEIDFFMTLVKKFKYQLVNSSENKDDLNVSEKDKNLVRDRVKNSKSSDLLNWDKVKDDFDGI